MLVLTADGNVTALAENDGQVLWQVELPAAPTGAVAITGSRMYVSAEDAHLYVLDIQNGRRLPRLDTNGRVLSCLTVGQYVIAAATSGTVSAFDGATGTHAWEELLPCPLIGGFATADRTVYVGGGDGVVYAIDTVQHGRVSSLHPMGQRIHTIAISHSGLHVAGADGGVISLSLRGTVSGWRLAAENGQIWACRADPASNLVATASVHGVLRLDDAATASNYLTRSDLGIIRRSLTLHNGILLVGSASGSLVALNVKDGRELVRQDGHSPLDAPPAVTASGLIVGGWLDGTVVGIPRPR